MSHSGLKPATRTEAEVRGARNMREWAAMRCDELGDAAFARLLQHSEGIATLAQRHYMTCAAAIRDLPLSDNGPETGAGTILASATIELVTGLEDMRRRGVIDEEHDGEWLDKILAAARSALCLVGRDVP
jgi:hypothetical protein